MSRFDPPRFTWSPLTGRVYVVTEGEDLGGGDVRASRKFDVTDQFNALAKQLGWTEPTFYCGASSCTCGNCPDPGDPIA
jgi:hypothetical protein